MTKTFCLFTIINKYKPFTRRRRARSSVGIGGVDGVDGVGGDVGGGGGGESLLGFVSLDWYL